MVRTGYGRPPEFLRRVHNRPALRRRHRLLALGRLLTVALGFVLGGIGTFAAYRYALTSPMFQLRSIVLSEVPEELIEAVETQLATVTGHNLLLLDLEALQRRLRTIPQVRDASVRRLLPDQIEVRVKQRSPWAALRATDGVYLVDRDAVVLGRTPTVAETLPSIHLAAPLASDRERTGAGDDDPPSGRRWLPDALAIIEWLLEASPPAFRGADHLRLDPGGVVLVFAPSGVEVALGEATALETKARNLASLMRSDPPSKPRQIDLRFADMVILRDLATPKESFLATP